MKAPQPSWRFFPVYLSTCSFLFIASTSVGWADLPSLQVSENKRFLVQSDRKPFFWLGDTAWELFHRLNREEANRYLENRAEKGYTVIQAVALAELDGHSDPNAYGHLPFIDQDPARPAVKDGPNNDYWDQVDYIVDRANALGMYIGFLPTWGRYWHDNIREGKPLFNAKNSEAYGEWLGKRYREKALIWILGGDRHVENEQQKEVIRAMARGLRKGDGGAHLQTFHPPGGRGSAQYFHEDDWLDLNMRQNGHVVKFNEGYHNTKTDYARTPVKPVLDGEPVYEDHPVSFRPQELGHSLAADVRRPLYWDLFSGACGHTYGHHSVWQMWRPGKNPINNPLLPWFEAIDQPGAGQMQYGRWLMESRPFLTRVPDDSIILSHRSNGSVAETRADAAAETKLTHLVYTREPSGKAALYKNGQLIASGTVAGDVSNWEQDLRLALGNELTSDRPWQGELHHVAIYPRAISPSEIQAIAKAGRQGKGTDGAIVRYEFKEGNGTVLKDTSGTGSALDLHAQNPSAMSWLPQGGVRLSGSGVIASKEPATKVIEAVKKSKAITIDVWLKPENTDQAGPARIVTISRDTGSRNATLGQKGGAYEVRFRTTATSPNGEPALSSPGGEGPSGLIVPTAIPGAGRYRLVATRDLDGTYAMVYTPAGRPFAVRMDVIQGEQVLAWWFNPRSGEATKIGLYRNSGQQQFSPPEKGEMLDWVLVLDDPARNYPPPGTR